MFSASIIGRLGGTPELRSTSAGKQVCSFTVATDHGWGENKKTTWTKVVLFGKDAENAAAWLSKGGRVAATGDVYLDKWKGNDGSERTTLCMEARSFENLEPRDGARRDEPATRSRSAAATPPDDDIPFSGATGI